MKKFIAVTVVVAFIALGAGLVLSKAVKAELEPFPWDDPIEEGASGHAILNYAQGVDMTEVQVNCWGLMPNIEYTVRLGTKGSPWQIIGSFTTRKNGSGNLHVRVDGDRSGVPNVAVNYTPGACVLMSR